MVQLRELSDEILLMVFSYLPQNALCKAAQVSKKWRDMAYDPSLWREIVVDDRSGMETLLKRATMLKTLDVKCTSVRNLEAISKLSKRFIFLEQLCVDLQLLPNPSVLSIVDDCRAVEAVILRGRGILVSKSVKILGRISSLKKLVVADDVLLRDDVFAELCGACRNLESLALNTKRICRNATWQQAEKLRHLRSLSVSLVSTSGLDTVSRNCPDVRVLEAGSVVYDGVSVTKALSRFKELEKVSIANDCGGEWFRTEHDLSSKLEVLDVRNLEPEERHVQRLADACSTRLRKLVISGASLTRETLRRLSSFESLEDVSLSEVPDDVPVLQMIRRMPRLRELKLDKEDIASEIAEGLRSIVDVTDVWEHGRTQLTVNASCPSVEDHDLLLRELYSFKEFLELNTRLSTKCIRDLEERWWQLKDWEVYWLPYGEGLAWTIETCIPVIGGRLRRLVLHGGGGY